MKNNIALVLDSSSSMSSLRSSVIKVSNDLLDSFKTSSKKYKQYTELSLTTFANSVNKVFSKNISKINEIKDSDYRVNGMTALLDAVGQTLEDFTKSDDYDDEDCSFLLLVVTDGQENASLRFNASKLTSLINRCQKTGRFTITFQVPKGQTFYLTNLGIPLENIREWEISESGLREVSKTMDVGTQTFYDARSRGLKAVNNFYHQIDLSGVSTKDLRKLDDLSYDFDSFPVTKEVDIKSWAEKCTGRPYVIGHAYYEITKPETVQGGKEIVIQDKKTNRLYGGNQARTLIGLPKGTTGKVDPLNLSSYRVFIKSTSVNRKLVRGTTLLVQK